MERSCKFIFEGDARVHQGTLFRSSESRSSKTSGFTCIKPDGPGCNSPVQRAKHTPFSGTSARKSYWIDRSLRASSFPPKSQRTPDALWLYCSRSYVFFFWALYCFFSIIFIIFCRFIWFYDFSKFI